jgi:hypothetical protein
MYFPYVRGKQFELIALKEYADDLGASGQVTPVIEPIKDPNSSGAMQRTLDALVAVGVRPTVVINPAVGDLRRGDPNTISRYLDVVDPRSLGVDAGIIVNADSTPESLASDLAAVAPQRAVRICHLAKNPELQRLGEVLGSRSRQHLVTSEARPRAYRAAFEDPELSVLSDRFPAQTRNKDYLPVTASEFSDDFLYYQEEGFAGFGDFLTIGANYSDGGFTPRAVAIHWTYQDRPEGPIMIRHFVSTSNDDISNVGRKYLEAVQKLIDFVPNALFVTKAAEVFRASLSASSYPGLGIVKKLSMQNHLEVVMRAITRQ